jgi:ABC-type transporter Mla subunit MlaD
MVEDQAKLAHVQAAKLEKYGESVQATLKVSGFSAALVIVGSDPAQPPTVYPTDNPVATALDHLDVTAAGTACYIVYIRTAPLVPEQLSCYLLTKRATDLSESRKMMAEENATLTALNSSTEMLRTDLTTLQGSLNSLAAQANSLSEELKEQQTRLKQQDDAAMHSRSDIENLAKVLAPTTQLVRFHEAQLRNTEKTLDTLIEQYSKTSAAVGQNNEQIDSLIKDLNASFAQVKATLDQMQQKLATVR